MLHDEITTMSNNQVKQLPLPPPNSAIGESTSPTETSITETTFDEKEEISLSEYRERLRQRHNVYGPLTKVPRNPSIRKSIPLYLQLRPTQDTTKPTTLRRIDQEEETSNDHTKTSSFSTFHTPPIHRSPFSSEQQNDTFPSPNLDAGSFSQPSMIPNHELVQLKSSEKIDCTADFSSQNGVVSPHQQEFLKKVDSRNWNSDQKDPFKYQSIEEDNLQLSTSGLPLFEDHQQQEHHQLKGSNSIKVSIRKLSRKLLKSTKTLNLTKSTSTSTFKTSIFPDLPRQENYTYFNQEKLEDQVSTFTAQTITTSRTSPASSSQYSLSPPPPLPPKSPPYLYTNKTPSFNTITNNPSISFSEFMASPGSPFWKYHILKIGKDLYLTTNPGMKHVYCRNAPGYFIEVVCHDPKLSIPTSESGYTLIFKDSGSLKYDSSDPYMVITKKSPAEGGHFTFTTPRENFLNEGTVMKFKDDNLFQGISNKEYIDKTYFPYDKLRANHPQCFKNYEVHDLHGVPWNVGSIPRIRASKVGKIRDKISSYYYDGTYQGNQEDEFKFIGKRNIYFHQNFVPPDSQGVKYKEHEAKYIYNHDYGKSFPPVLSMFRPYENKMRKRVIQSVKNHSDVNGPYIDVVEDDYGTGSSKFYQGSDGLYYVRNTSDDLPDENKLGWITIYEDNEIFGGINNRGMFDLVLGMTLAVGYDSCLS